VIGLRPIIALFGTKPSYLRAACKLAWRYALLQEILSELSENYEVRSETDLRNTIEFARLWQRVGKRITQRLLHSLHAKVASLETNRELQWVREIYHEHERRVIVKLPASVLAGWLSKLRNPQKHDAADKGLGSLLDTYERMYVRLGGPAKRSGKAKRGKSR